MDTDWCLHCNCKIEEGSQPYCSRRCYDLENSSLTTPSISELDIDDNEFVSESIPLHPCSFKNCASIQAWASAVTPGPPPQASVRPTSPTVRPRLPKLLLPHQRPNPPTLCMSIPQPARPHPSLPITTPKQHITSLSAKSIDFSTPSSTVSATTEPFVETPSSPLKPSVFGVLASHVRSWSPLAQKPVISTMKYFPEAEDHTRSNFTVLAKTHLPSHLLSPLHQMYADDSDEDTSEDDDNGFVWTHAHSGASKKGLDFDEKAVLPQDRRPRRLDLSRALRVADDHPAYRARGRKMSRAVL